MKRLIKNHKIIGNNHRLGHIVNHITILCLGSVRYLCLRGGRCLEWGGKIFKINEKGGVFFLNTIEIRGVNF